MNRKHKSVIIILVMISLLYLLDLWNISQTTVDYNIIDGVKGYFWLVFLLGVFYLVLNLIVHIKKKYSKSAEEIENIRIEKLNQSIRLSNEQFEKTFEDVVSRYNKKTKSKTKSNSNTEDD
jgi:surface polysaccharide O-acyltransferase-like enzyme